MQRQARQRARRASTPPWPAVTPRAGAFTLRYGLLAYVVSFGGALALDLVLYLSGVRIGIGPGVLIVDAFLLGSLAPLIRRGGLSRRDLGLRGTRLGPATGLAVLTIVAYLSLSAAWVVLVIGTTSRAQDLTKQFGIPPHPGTFTVILDVFVMALCAPVCEEIFFRGLLFRSLRNRLSLWPAALIAGGLFGLVHATSYPLDTIPIKILFGVLMCLLYERTGSLLPGIAVHSFVDGSGADAIFTGRLTIALIVAGAVLLVIGVRTFVAGLRTPPSQPLGPSGEPYVPW